MALRILIAETTRPRTFPASTGAGLLGTRVLVAFSAADYMWIVAATGINQT